MGEAAKSVRINYVKVAELQRRAIPHFHAVVRLDAPPVPAKPTTTAVSSITAADLVVVVQRAAHAVTLTVTVPERPGDGDARVLRFGTPSYSKPGGNMLVISGNHASGGR